MYGFLLNRKLTSSTYLDDGKGIDKSKTESKGLGMSSIDTRINIMQGTTKFHEDFDTGYKLEFVV